MSNVGWVCNCVCCREVYQEYCKAMEEASLAIMEVLGVSLGLGRGYYRDFFADGSSIMRCNYYPRCPEPDRTMGTGPHCDPSALTILLQDGAVDGLQVFLDGAWRSVRPKPGVLVVNIGDTFMVRTVACALDLPDLGTPRCRVASRLVPCPSYVSTCHDKHLACMMSAGTNDIVGLSFVFV
jgi:hypothetical protein